MIFKMVMGSTAGESWHHSCLGIYLSSYDCNEYQSGYCHLTDECLTVNKSPVIS